jgi:hypothetical protein
VIGSNTFRVDLNNVPWLRTYTREGAELIRVCFDGFQAEPYYDYVEIRDDAPSVRAYMKFCGCVFAQNDENSRGWGQGVCHTPHHFVTKYTDIV